jgi:GntR family transcriptional regulator, transcriptional repressor for pyruvate dehydrogenase complex
MSSNPPRLQLARQIADRLRDLVFTQEPGIRIGSLHELADRFEVGIVTFQQAARILEHEGLLEVRRGPGGGYFGVRPDEAALERAMGAYIRMHPTAYQEALDITSLLFNELVAAAARSEGDEHRRKLRALATRIDDSSDDARRIAFEADFQDLLFQMVERPLFEILTRVTLRFADMLPAGTPLFAPDAEAVWKAGRHRIIDAILKGDEELARFEANRSNRRLILAAIARLSKHTTS